MWMFWKILDIHLEIKWASPQGDDFIITYLGEIWQKSSLERYLVMLSYDALITHAKRGFAVLGGFIVWVIVTLRADAIWSGGPNYFWCGFLWCLAGS